MDHIISEPAPTRPQAGAQGPDPALNGHRPASSASLLGTIPAEYQGQFLLTEAANGMRFAQQFGGQFRYVAQWGRWLWWDGRRWAEDDGSHAWKVARMVAASIYDEAGEVAERGDKGYARQLADFADRSLSDHGLRAMLHQAETWEGIATAPEEFDSHPWLLNCHNGVVDLRTGKLGPHDPALLITRLVDINFDPDARCPRWLRFLLEIMGHNKAMVRFLQRAIGYSLTADVSEEAVFILHGTGANGKSTKIQILRELAGDYGENVQPETLASVRYQSGSAPTPDVARLRSARCVTTVETAEGFHLNEPLIKQLTSREPLTARFLHRDPFEFSPTFKIWLATNHRPAVRGTDWGIWRRLRLISFSITIPPDKRDPHLIDRLRAELSGILAWAVRGCLAWQREGLGVPPEVIAATQAYREDMDVLGAFLAECCSESVADSVLNKQLYGAYVMWCEDGHEYPVKNREFCRRLEERGLVHDRAKSGYEWRGLALRPEVLEELASVERRKSGKGGGGRFSDDSPKAAELPQRFQANDPSGPVAEIWRPCPMCGNSTLAPDFVCHVCTAGDDQQSPRSGQGEVTPNHCPDCGGSPREGAHDYGDGPRCELHDRPLTHSARGGGV